ncbi:M42 family metallopeptidase [Limnochorda pilosa]|uniref:Peptidase M28 n=1 Tax=Limnochorda pilosa TaxID=1555112 RepID=A0A0K2SIS7_LIMPI|nr:M42 family metallopeptidase [Limnochorda pilosa]BAS27013.1 peptidase M28 [Limnochorda pilosa]
MQAWTQLLQELTEAPGVPGFEGPVRDVMRRHLEPVADEIVTDNLGGVAGVLRGASGRPRVMVAGHLDEVGFMVSHVTGEGFLRFQTLGGWWHQVMLAQRVRVLTRQGEHTGVIGSKPPHLLSPEDRKKPVEIAEMFIDVGATSREEAEALGIRPGDPVVPLCPFTRLGSGKLLMAKAWDNRAGCAAAVRVLHDLKGSDHPNTVYGVGNVQEEVGLRGAQTMSERIDPDVAFAVDVGIAGDTPGVKETEARARLGQGPVVLLYDASMVPHRGLRDLVVDTAAEEGIPLQFEVMPRGGTDAGRMHLHGSGTPSLALGPPVRYIHSHASVLHEEDLEQTVRLLTAVIRRLDAETARRLREQ